MMEISVLIKQLMLKKDAKNVVETSPYVHCEIPLRNSTQPTDKFLNAILN